MSATAQTASPIESAIASTIKDMFARGELSLELPDENIIQTVITRFPHIGGNPVEQIKVIAQTAGKRLDAMQQHIDETLAKRPKAVDIDEGKVRQIADSLFQETYAKHTVQTAHKGTSKPLPALEPVDEFFVSNDNCDKIQMMIETGRHVMISGPSGSCKTYPVEQVLRRMGRRYVLVSVAEGMNTLQFIAGNEVTVEAGVSVTSHPDGIVTYCARNNIVCILDEVDNTQMENLACLRNVMTSGVITVPQTGERVVAGAEFLLVFTCNGLRDSTGNYSGYRIDNAISNRCKFIKADYLPAADEIAILERCGLSSPAAKQLVNTFKGLRSCYTQGKINQAPSTRIAVDVAMMMQGKDRKGKKATAPMSLREAMDFCLLNSLPDAEFNEAAAVLKQGL